MTRLVTYAHPSGERVGVLVGNGAEVVDLADVAPDLPRDLVSLLGAGPDALAAAGSAARSAPGSARRPIADVALLAPIPRPGKLIGIGYNYAGHNAAGAVDLPEVPDVFAKTGNTVVGPGVPVVLPAVSDQVEGEAELGVVIGRRGRDVREASALDHVAGYTLVNDVSARDYQNRGSQWLLGKSFDTFGPLGPAVVTADEIPDPQDLGVELRVDGEVRQHASTRDMIFTVPFLVAYVSHVMTLEPGDVIATGTPATLPPADPARKYLAHGDVMEVTISGLGTLTNPVVRAGR